MAQENLNRSRQNMIREIYHGNAKTRVDSEIVLPDYKEDVHRIISTDSKPRITKKETYREGQFVYCVVEGIVAFNIIYQSERREEKGVVSSVTVHANFDHTFKVSSPGEEADDELLAANLELSPENCVCKLLGPRKISVRADINVSLSLHCNLIQEYYSPELPAQMHAKTASSRVVRLAAHAEEDFSFSESIHLPKEYMAIGEVVDADVAFFADEIRPSAGKLFFSGLCSIHCSYVSDDEESFISFYQPIEFSNTLEIDECEEDTFCEVMIAPNLLKINVEPDEDGDNKWIRLEVGYTAETNVYQNEEIVYCQDVFSTESALKTESVVASFEQLASMIHTTSEEKASFSLKNEDLIRAESIKAAIDFQNSYVENGQIAVESKLNLHFLGVREDETLVGCDEVLDLKFAVKPDREVDLDNGELNLRVEISGGVKHCDVDINGRNATVRCDVFQHIKIFSAEKAGILSEITLQEPLPGKEKGMIFYYPAENETLWEIAKKYRVPVESLAEENQIEAGKMPEVLRIII